MRIDRLDREDADRALLAPVEREGAQFATEALAALFAASGGYPYFVQAYGKATWDAAPRSPIAAEDVAVAAPEAEAELAVGFFGSRYDRATAAEREYLRAMAELSEGGDEPVATAGIADTWRGGRPRFPGQGQPDAEGAGVLRAARPDRFHGAALRPVPAGPRLRYHP